MKPFNFFKGYVYSDEYTIPVQPNLPIDERYPEYYNTDEYVFFDVTQVMTDPDSVRPYKFMLFRHIEDGYTVDGQRIYSDHPMYNFPDVI
jgi:hypothetical protein